VLNGDSAEISAILKLTLVAVNAIDPNQGTKSCINAGRGRLARVQLLLSKGASVHQAQPSFAIMGSYPGGEARILLSNVQRNNDASALLVRKVKKREN